MSAPRFKTNGHGFDMGGVGKNKKAADYQRLAVIYKDDPDLPWLTHKAYAVDGVEQAKADAAEMRNTIKKKGFVVKVVKLAVVEVIDG